jgi:mRNA interferase HigB
MKIVALSTLKAFWTRHPDAKGPLQSWYSAAAEENWTTPQDIKNRYRSADFIGDRRVVFNIGGNHYRLIVAVAYRTGWVYVKFVGTHADYDKVDAASVEM